MIDNLKNVFDAYGSWRALWESSYIRLSIVLTILSFQVANTEKWVGISQSVLPSMLGFSIAAIAIVTVIGDDGFRGSLSKIFTLNEKFSDLECLMASFVWFIFIQVITIIYSIIYESKPYDYCKVVTTKHCVEVNVNTNMILSYTGTFLTFYSILLIIGSTFLMFQLFRLYVRNISPKNLNGKKNAK